MYGLPYLVVNGWLVTYTWLQHTDLRIPHFSTEQWSWEKGALQTVDRPYGPLLNLLHHGIGSTHVCHHVNARIPHYNAWRGRELLKRAFPDLVRYDPTPIHKALWRIATRCGAVHQSPVDKASTTTSKRRASRRRSSKPDERGFTFLQVSCQHWWSLSSVCPSTTLSS